jgi:RNA polymerase sigma factor (sigma-70 family)
MNDAPSQKKWELTQEAFDKLLACFDPDRERAGEKYEQLRHKLILYFEGRRCLPAEDCVDETFNRVAKRIDEGEQIRDLTNYAFGVARRVFLEHQRDERERLTEPPTPPPEENSDEVRLRCLDQCLERLPPKDREIALQYYQAEQGREKIENRRRLATLLDITPNALRIRVNRLRDKLEACVKECLEKREES